MKRNDTEISLLLMKEAKIKGAGKRSAPHRRTLGDITNGDISATGDVQKTSYKRELCGDTELCGNCGVNVPKANAAMHEAMCFKRFFRCPFCSTCIEAGEKEAHLNVDDAQVTPNSSRILGSIPSCLPGLKMSPPQSIGACNED